MTNEQRKFLKERGTEIRNDQRSKIRGVVKRKFPVTKAERKAQRVIASASNQRDRYTNQLRKKIDKLYERVQEAHLFGKVPDIEKAIHKMLKFKVG